MCVRAPHGFFKVSLFVLGYSEVHECTVQQRCQLGPVLCADECCG